MLRRLYDWTMDLASRKNAVWALCAVAFIESSVFPIPPDILLIPMVLAARDKAWRYAAMCTIASVLGGMLGYAIGAGLYDSVGRPIMDFYHLHDEFNVFTEKYNEWGIWVVVGAAITFLPFKLATIASGITGLEFTSFVYASIAGRAFRFFVVAALLYYFGQPIRDFIEKRLGLMFTIFCVLLIGGFALLKLIA